MKNEALRLSVELLYKEDPSPEILRDLNILVLACMWSKESHKIVVDAAQKVRDEHIMADGQWKLKEKADG